MNSLCNISESSLIIIPDISGFTRFVNKTDIIHSQSKIGILLESILGSNNLGLSMDEIEGDAILFYKFEDSFSAFEVYEQCNNMFRKFHEILKTISNESNCNCGACKSLKNLSLKFIVHSGELCSMMISNYCKIFGLDLIVAHKLLKNNIDSREYILFTDDFLRNRNKNGLESLAKTKKITSSFFVYDEIGRINYSYIQLCSDIIKV